MTSSLISKVDLSGDHKFLEPVKRIHDGPDVTFFLTSMAYKDITQFILQLNRAMIPRKGLSDDENHARSWPLTNDETKFPPSVQQLRTLLSTVDALIAEAPPDPGPRRFGNASFRTWYGLVEKQVGSLLHDRLSADVLQAQVEIQAYFLGSFGSPQRLDYGTGHELSFLAFLGCLWKLSYFNDAEASVEERAIVLGVFEPYLRLIRKLIKTYNLEPAGSHGVWGLDDNSFLPYIFGSAQLAPAIAESDVTPTQGSMTNAPDPSSIVKANLVDKEKDHNMYFSAIAFINDVKRGPFWEHSPMLFDISGIKDGWGKINKGMLKMYNAEVLSKFPVVQHFPFGSLFRWEKDPEAREISATTHTASQPLRNPIDASAPAQNRPMGPPSTAAPWAGATRAPPRGFVNGVTQAPWANRSPAPLAPSPASSLRAVPPTIKPQATNKPALPGTPENP